jgi:membrane fusion protein, macrolide-specific efflux system
MSAKLKIIALIVVVVGIFVGIKIKSSSKDVQTTKEVRPVRGTIETSISATGSVLPRNRLEIKPPVGGRIDRVFVKEGEYVKAGQLLASMSSSERAALLDAARGQSEEQRKYLEDAYKGISLIAPIDAQVIVATTQPGQTVTAEEAVVVLSDQLIVRAQVDETDIGKIKPGETAMITLDAYSDSPIKGSVAHIYYESKTVNNVTMYEVDLAPETVPDFFRSGMNATISFITKHKDNILMLPADAVIHGKNRTFVFVKTNDPKESARQPVELGISDDKNVEIVSGVSEDDTIVIKSKKYSLPKTSDTNNPFMPSRRPGGSGGGGRGGR